MYIDNVHKKFGGFNYAKVRTALHPEVLSEHLFTQIPSTRNANQNQAKPKPLAGRRKSIFTIPMLRRKSIAEQPANNPKSRRKSVAEPPAADNGPRKIETRRRTTFVPSATKNEAKALALRPNTPNILERNAKLETKTLRSHSALKRKLPQLEYENPAKRIPNNPHDVLMHAIELKSKALEKNGVVLKRHQQQPVRPINGGIFTNKTPTKNAVPQTQIVPMTDRPAPKTPLTGRSTLALKTPTGRRSTSAPKTPILPSMPNVFDNAVDNVNSNVDGNHLPDPRLRIRNPSSVYQTRPELSSTNILTPRVNGLNGAKSPKSKRDSICQAFMLKMHTGLRELVSGLSEELHTSATNKPDAKMKMLLELENAKQLEIIEEKHNSTISELEKVHRENLRDRNAAHKKQIEDLQKAQFDKTNELKDKFQTEIKKKNSTILKLQEELNALRNMKATSKK